MDSKTTAAAAASLVPLPAKEGTEPIILDAGQTTIGRVSTNTIQLSHGGVSRVHAVIAWEAGKYILSDLGSRNGTFVNNRKTNRAVLNHGDRIMFGKRGFVFLDNGAQAATEPVALAADCEETVCLSTEELEQTKTLMNNAYAAAQNFFQARKSDSDEIQDPHSARERISGLYHLSENLRTLKDSGKILEEGLDFILNALPVVQRAVVMLRSSQSGALEPRAVRYRHPDQADGRIPVSRSILERVMREQVAIVNRNVQEDPCFEKSDSVIAHDIQSIICVPLMSRRQVIGALHLDSDSSLSPFTGYDMEFTAAVANELALSIENLSLQEKVINSEKMAAIGLTVTNLAHNIKNLLTIHLSSVDLLDAELQDKVDADTLKNWRLVRNSLEKIAGLTSEMLEYARVKNVAAKAIDVNATIAAQCKPLAEKLAKEGISLELNLAPSLPNWKIDKKHFEHAILNLVVNAKDALKGVEGAAIKISTEIKEGRRLIVRVADNGCGIAPKDLNRVFDLFYTTKGLQGNGIGLAMIQKFVERQGGDIRVDSKPGAGAVFSMIFACPDNA